MGRLCVFVPYPFVMFILLLWHFKMVICDTFY